MKRLFPRTGVNQGSAHEPRHTGAQLGIEGPTAVIQNVPKASAPDDLSTKHYYRIHLASNRLPRSLFSGWVDSQIGIALSVAFGCGADPERAAFWTGCFGKQDPRTCNENANCTGEDYGPREQPHLGRAPQPLSCALSPRRSSVRRNIKSAAWGRGFLLGLLGHTQQSFFSEGEKC